MEVPVARGLWRPLDPRPEPPHPMLRIDLSPMQGEVNTCLRGNVGVICGRDVSIIGLFCVSRRGAARIRSGVSRSGDPPIPRPDLARWLVRTALQAGDARFPSARERRRSGQERRTFKFSCIWLHFCCIPISQSYEGTCRGPGCAVPVCTGPLEAPCPRPEHPHPMLRIDLSPIQGEVNTCLRGKDGCIRGNDACRQCRGWRGGGAMGSCREVERWAGYALSLGAPDAGLVIVAWNIRWFTWRLAWQR